MDHNYANWIETFLGHPIDPLNPECKRIYFLDIAHALSNQCRFSGHTKYFYSVAQHSVHVSELVRDEGHSRLAQLLALLHDASEAYLQDMPTPIKRQMPRYSEAEAKVQRVILETFLPAMHFLLRDDYNEAIKKADLVMLATEARDLMANPNVADEWQVLRGVTPRREKVICYHPEGAKALFINRFHELTKDRSDFLSKDYDRQQQVLRDVEV